MTRAIIVAFLLACGCQEGESSTSRPVSTIRASRTDDFGTSPKGIRVSVTSTSDEAGRIDSVVYNASTGATLATTSVWRSGSDTIATYAYPNVVASGTRVVYSGEDLVAPPAEVNIDGLYAHNWAAAVFYSLTTLANQPDPVQWSNGCNWPCSNTWKSCCDGHDACYCMQSKPRKGCDADFHNWLLAQGAGQPLAYLYWLGVRLGGWYYYGKGARGT